MFTKKNLKTGMVVETADGDRFLVILGYINNSKEGILLNTDSWMRLEKFTNTLEYGASEFDNKFSIVKVFDDKVYGLSPMLDKPENLIWEHKKEEEVDWNTVPVDTIILVRDYEDEDWIPAYFAEYNNGVVYVWEDGGTSFTKTNTEAWCYAKLYEEDN